MLPLNWMTLPAVCCCPFLHRDCCPSVLGHLVPPAALVGCDRCGCAPDCPGVPARRSSPYCAKAAANDGILAKRISCVPSFALPLAIVVRPQSVRPAAKTCSNSRNLGETKSATLFLRHYPAQSLQYDEGMTAPLPSLLRRSLDRHSPSPSAYSSVSATQLNHERTASSAGSDREHNIESLIANVDDDDASSFRSRANSLDDVPRSTPSLATPEYHHDHQDVDGENLTENAADPRELLRKQLDNTRLLKTRNGPLILLSAYRITHCNHPIFRRSKRINCRRRIIKTW